MQGGKRQRARGDVSVSEVDLQGLTEKRRQHVTETGSRPSRCAFTAFTACKLYQSQTLHSERGAVMVRKLLPLPSRGHSSRRLRS
eukprot:2168303-Rhodomonas_salina.5